MSKVASTHEIFGQNLMKFHDLQHIFLSALLISMNMRNTDVPSLVLSFKGIQSMEESIIQTTGKEISFHPVSKVARN